MTQSRHQNIIEEKGYKIKYPENKADGKRNEKVASHEGFISLSISKADILMDLIGELVISESMVTQNPDLDGLELDNFQKSARQLRKIITEM